MVAWEAHVAGFVFGVIVGLVGRGRLKQHATTTEQHVPGRPAGPLARLENHLRRFGEVGGDEVGWRGHRAPGR